jgi:hypothetical protein
MKSEDKTMFIIFFGIKGIVHKEFVLAGKGLNSPCYCRLLQRLRENVRGLLIYEYLVTIQISNLPNPSDPTGPWGLLSLLQK